MPYLPLCLRTRARHSIKTSQYRGLVEGDVVGLVALDFVLRLGLARMVSVAFVVDVSSVDFDDFTAHPAGFRIPTDAVANCKRLDHGSILVPQVNDPSLTSSDNVPWVVVRKHLLVFLLRKRCWLAIAKPLHTSE